MFLFFTRALSKAVVCCFCLTNTDLVGSSTSAGSICG